MIPAFAVGRTQEVLNYIRIIKEKNLVTGHGVFPVYLDSPMAVEATGVFKDNMMDCYNEETKELVKKGINPISFPGLHLSITSSDSVAINFNEEPKVIISAAGCGPYPPSSETQPLETGVYDFVCWLSGSRHTGTQHY